MFIWDVKIFHHDSWYLNGIMIGYTLWLFGNGCGEISKRMGCFDGMIMGFGGLIVINVR